MALTGEELRLAVLEQSIKYNSTKGSTTANLIIEDAKRFLTFLVLGLDDKTQENK
jgi:hypothetical protein